MTRGNGLVDRRVTELQGEGVERLVEGHAALDTGHQTHDVGLHRRRCAGHRRLDGGQETPVGGHAVAQRLDPGGQGLQAPHHPVRGVGLESGAQRPTHGTADGGAHRPVGDEPDDESERDGTQRRLAVGRVEPLHHRHPPHRRGGRPQAPDDEGQPGADAGADENDDRGHRP